jgi:hypothetical protein
MSHVSRRMRDGSTVSGSPEVVAATVAHEEAWYAAQARWVADLRARGIKAAHPDDGWVNRERNTIHFCYPQFRDRSLGVGDLIALGSHHWSTRIVRVTGFSANPFAPSGESEWWYVHFEAIRGWPQRKPTQ